ncbi:hypothetical protein OAA91_01995 [Fibrobacterales bacterium]|nr:hypothetical protein [Fibrobacterales bacterium]
MFRFSLLFLLFFTQTTPKAEIKNPEVAVALLVFGVINGLTINLVTSTAVWGVAKKIKETSNGTWASTFGYGLLGSTLGGAAAGLVVANSGNHSQFPPLLLGAGLIGGNLFGYIHSNSIHTTNTNNSYAQLLTINF